MTLAGGQSLQVQFRLDVPFSISSTGTLSVNIVAGGVDVTSGAPFVANSPSPGSLIVQTGSNLQFTAINVGADSVFVGQNNIPVSATVQNVGGADAKLNSVTLQLEDSTGSDVTFPTTLQTITLPDTISSAGTMDVDFLLSIPSSVMLPPDGDSLIFAGAILSGEDLNSGTLLADTVNMAGPVDSFLVVDEAEIVFVDFLSPTLYNIGESVAFQIDVGNIGGINYSLDGSTTLRLVKENDLDTEILIPLNTGFTPSSLPAGGEVTLIFQLQQLNLLGNFRLFLDISGTAGGQQVNFPGISTPQSISVGGDISFSSFDVTPAIVALGQQGVTATLAITNQGGSALPIDAAETVLVFNYVSDGEPLPIIAQRQDTLTALPAGELASLIWNFDIPQGARSDDVNTQARLSFDNGEDTTSFSTTFFIESNANISYVDASLTPASVVPGADVLFEASFLNSGSTSLQVDADSSFIEFTDGINIYKANVNGNFSINGNATNILLFESLVVDPAFLQGNYDTYIKVVGELPNGEDFTAVNDTFPGQITILRQADVAIDSIAILPTSITAGQDGIEVKYFLTNNGESPALINSATSVFTDTLDNDVSNFWSTQSETSFTTLNPAQTDSITRFFNVSQNITGGQYLGRLEVNFSDAGTPLVENIIAPLTPFDTVNVVELAALQFTSVGITSPDGATDQIVSTHQKFIWELQLTHKANSGPLEPNDSTEITLDFTNRGFFFDSLLTVSMKKNHDAANKSGSHQ